VRFGTVDPGRHFYQHGFRFDAMFEQLVSPLRDNRSIHFEADYTEETATEYRTHSYEFTDVDVVIVEAVFLFQPAFHHHFDLRVWVDCTFETALERAISRGQEGLPPAATIEAFETIYFPAQRAHFAKDNPREAADLVFVNDHRLAGK